MLRLLSRVLHGGGSRTHTTANLIGPRNGAFLRQTWRAGAVVACAAVWFAPSSANADDSAPLDDKSKTGETVLDGRSIPPGYKDLDHFKALWTAKQWSDLAASVTQSGKNLDLLWFYLGEAANGLGYSDAATIYYKKALDLTLDKNNTHKCVFYSHGAILTGTDFCSGFTFPNDISAKLSPQDAVAATPAATDAAAPKYLDISELQRQYSVVGYVLASMETCGWPLSQEQKQNGYKFINTTPHGLTFDQSMDLKMAAQEEPRKIAAKGRLDFCEDDSERKKYDKRAAMLWPVGQVAAPAN